MTSISDKGSIKQDSNGKWNFVVDLGRDPYGKRIQKRKRGFNSKEEAESALEKVLAATDIDKPVLMYKFDKDNLKQDSIKGFAGENIVKANLILKGLIPFHSEVPSSVVDVIALYYDKTYRIQIKTSEFKEDGSMQVNNIHKYNRNDFDILAVVDIETNNVAYLKWEDFYFRTSLYLHKLNNKKGNKIIFSNFLSFPF